MEKITYPFLSGKTIYLKSLEFDDLKNIARWLHDKDVTRFLHQGYRPMTVENLKNSYDIEGVRDDEFSFSIIDKKTNKSIGWTGLYQVNWISRFAEMRIFLGEKNFWHKGIATESQKLLLEYGFDKLNLHRIFAGTNIKCLGEQGALKKLFMTEEGVSRKTLFRNGEYYDVVHFGILKDEYLKIKKEKWKSL
jgi:[ribosomal protein S5]-alanine N-acetyltransferase